MAFVTFIHNMGWTRSLNPTFLDGSQKLLLVLLHLLDKRLILGFFMPGGPENHFREHGSEIDAFCGERVDQLSPVGGIRLGGDDSIHFQPAQAIGQNVCGDSFVGLQEFLVAPESAQHHVAEDEQRPAIAQHFHGGIEGTSGATLGR